MLQKFKKTKIIATIGPASMRKSVLKKMYESGLNCARINTAHGTFSEYKTIIKRIREVCNIPIMLDIKGPEVRLKTTGDIPLKKGQKIEVGFDKGSLVSFTYNLYDEVKKNTLILIEDGKIKTKVVDKKNNALILKSLTDSVLKNGKGVNIPSVNLKTPPLSKKDAKAIEFAIKNKIEYIALSFTRNAEDIERVKKLLKNSGIKIIAKIENSEGIQNIKEILDSCSGIMVARGDLGIEIAAERLPILQKKLIKKANQLRKIAIVATEMLQSMIKNSRATRAETSDVANAILDGADAVMLSGETAVGNYPVNAVNTMKKIALQVENHTENKINTHIKSISEAIAESAYELSENLRPNLIIVITKSGYTPKMIARYRVDMPILAVTDNKLVSKQLELVYAVKPLLVPVLNKNITAKDMIKVCSQHKLTKRNDLIVFVSGSHKPKRQVNRIEVHKVSDLLDSK